jgi:selenocysteine lyase/cysteine desulfurase
MIPCQKDKFDIPHGITYLNCAYTSPLLRESEKKGLMAVGAKKTPWKIFPADFLITTAHKWLLGPYSMGFCYVHPRWQKGVPLEENWLNRKGSQDFSRLVDYQDEYQPGARRFDVGESSNFFLGPVAEASLAQLAEWGIKNIAETLEVKTDKIAEAAEKSGYKVPSKPMRSPHLIGLIMPEGVPKDLSLTLAQKNIYVSIRGDAIRIAPHLYTTDGDIRRLFEVLELARL